MPHVLVDNVHTGLVLPSDLRSSVIFIICTFLSKNYTTAYLASFSCHIKLIQCKSVIPPVIDGMCKVDISHIYTD